MTRGHALFPVLPPRKTGNTFGKLWRIEPTLLSSTICQLRMQIKTTAEANKD